MSRDLVEVETSPQTVSWLLSLQSLIHDYSDSCGYSVFSRAAARERGLLVVPFFEPWSPKGSPLLNVLRSRKYAKIYGLGLELRKGLCLSAPLQEEAVGYLVFKLISRCLLAVKSEDFFMLHTPYNYSLLIGCSSLIIEASGGSIERAFREFEESVTSYGEEEPGFDFSRAIVQLYRLHNAEILKLSSSV